MPSLASHCCFNEAGILHPGMRLLSAGVHIDDHRFNEAGILHPGMRAPCGRRALGGEWLQ